MSFFRKYQLPLIAGTLISALGGAAYAHKHAADGPGWHESHHGYGHHRGGWGRHGMKAEKHIDGILAFAEAELKITDAQQPAWTEFSDSMRELINENSAYRQSKIPQRDELANASLVERIDHRLASLERRQLQLRKMADAVKKIYAALTPEQQRLADELAPMRRF